MSVQILLDRIDRVRGRERTVAVTAGLFKTVLAIVSLVAGFFLLDWLILSRVIGQDEASRFARGVLLAAMGATLLYVLWQAVWRELRRELDDDEIALRVEKRHPELHGRLISTIQLTRDLGEGIDVGSVELVEALESDTVSFAQALDFTKIVNLQMLKKVALAAALLVLVSVGAGLLRPDFLQVLIGRMLLAQEAYPTATRILAVKGGYPIHTVQKVPRGESFELWVELDGGGFLPEVVEVVAELDGDAAGDEMIFPLKMEVAGEPAPPHGGVMYRGTIERVMENLKYTAIAYDAEWKWWERLRVLQRPAIKSLELTYIYPAYTGRPERTSSVGDIRALVGTKVQIVAELKPDQANSVFIRRARLQQRLGQEILAPAAMDLSEDGGTARAEIVVVRDGYFKILLEDSEKLQNVNPIEYVIDAVPDKAPVVKITFPARDRTVTKFATWPIRFDVRDDFGIGRGFLKYRITSLFQDAGAEGLAPDPQAAPVESFVLEGLVQGKNQKEARALEIPFDLRMLDLKPDQRVNYWIEIEDTRTPIPNVGRSKEYEFNIAETAIVEDLLDRDRDDALSRIEMIRRKEIENREGVDKIRTAIRRGELKPVGQKSGRAPRP